MIDPHSMPTGDAARITGLSTERLRQLDDELEPIRLANGQRRYRPSVVAAFARQRDAAKGK